MIIVANIIIAGKKTLTVDDSIIKNFKGRRLNKRITSQVSTKPTPGAATKGMIHHVKGCLQDTSAPNTIIVHLGTNDSKRKSNPEQIADNIISLVTSVKSDENCGFV